MMELRQGRTDFWGQIARSTAHIAPSWIPGFGRLLFLIACLMLGIVEMYFGAALPGLHPWPVHQGLAWFSGASLALLAIGGLLFDTRLASLGLAIHWFLAILFTIAVAVKGPTDALNWVPVAQSCLFAVASFKIASQREAGSSELAPLALRLTFAAMLLLFGLIHIFKRELIAGLIPGWIPAADLWPWVTGTIMVAAGFAILIGKFAEIASLVVAGMFASWIFVVHAERLAQRPASDFEWTFALTALALAGAALITIRGENRTAGR